MPDKKAALEQSQSALRVAKAKLLNASRRVQRHAKEIIEVCKQVKEEKN